MSGRIPAEVFPPGDYIRDEIEARGWTQNDLAEILGRPIRLVNEVVSGKRAITPETARGLGDAFGTGAQVWMNLESAYRLSKVEADGDAVARRAKLFSLAPVKDMARRGWINDVSDPDGLERELLGFFGVRTIEEIESLEQPAAARKSTSYDVDTPEQRAWLRRVKVIASTIKARPYEDDSLERLLNALRLLLPNAQDVCQIPALFAEHGIRFLVVEHLPKTRFDGVALWLSEAPVVAVTLRLDRVDSFWFTLVHELGHISNRDAQESIDINIAGDGAGDTDASAVCERKANEFAREFLLPKRELDAFVGLVRPFYSRVKINQFSRLRCVHPGIVVGQLQRRGEIPYSQGRDMLLKVRDAVTQTAITDGWGHLPGDRP